MIWVTAQSCLSVCTRFLKPILKVCEYISLPWYEWLLSPVCLSVLDFLSQSSKYVSISRSHDMSDCSVLSVCTRFLKPILKVCEYISLPWYEWLLSPVCLSVLDFLSQSSKYVSISRSHDMSDCSVLSVCTRFLKPILKVCEYISLPWYEWLLSPVCLSVLDFLSQSSKYVSISRPHDMSDCSVLSVCLY